MKNTLRKIELRDISRLSELLMAFWKSQLCSPSESDVLEDIRRMLDPKGIGRLVCHGDDIAGFIYVNEKYGYLNNIEYLYIDKAFRGKGLATFAIEEIKKMVLAKDNERVQIEVSPNNVRALKLYHRLGFTSIDTVTLSTGIAGKTEDIVLRDLTFRINPKEAFQKSEK
ncbi:MAG TPA: GNAT family N-acetyltransferase [Candidatus Enterosoma merdigallinarum]|nr:GNAT family N-acetyltransferase [Candidatus Enterosoma merdigallinarum]